MWFCFSLAWGLGLGAVFFGTGRAVSSCLLCVRAPVWWKDPAILCKEFNCLFARPHHGLLALRRTAQLDVGKEIEASDMRKRATASVIYTVSVSSLILPIFFAARPCHSQLLRNMLRGICTPGESKLRLVPRRFEKLGAAL